MSVPDVRARLYKMAEERNDEELRDLADRLWRVRAKRRAPVQSRPFTPKVAAQIRRYARENPDVPSDVIAQVFRVNPGRVSDALHGKK